MINNQGTELEYTVVQMLNQGCFSKTRCNRFRGSFLLLFWRSKKVKDKIFIGLKKNLTIIELFNITAG